jgi:hypothetical protein
MKKIQLLILLLPFIAFGHPGVGIVKDSKGNIFYTDLHQVWKISNGAKKIVVPNVHTHELWIDANDNLYGENDIYEQAANKFYHYLWVYTPNGTIDTVLGMRESYINQDYSLARDGQGNEYYIKQFLTQPDTNHIYKRTPERRESVFATGNFKGVTWLHPQKNGTLLFILHNNLYRVDTSGKSFLIKEAIANKSPSFAFSGNSTTIWGVWEDDHQNVYAAVFSDQKVKRIDSAGNMSDYYTSKGNWAPLHGVFDDNDRLWVLESSDKNDVRVTLVEANSTPISNNRQTASFYYYVLGFFLCGFLVLYLVVRNYRKYQKGN